MTTNNEPTRTPQSLSHTVHGHTSRQLIGSKYSPTYSSWMAMRTRCNNSKRDNADRYYERGIKICPRWESFENFLQDMGERPKGKTLDRWPNKHGDYEPGNCRWASPRDQARNTRRSVLTLETATEVAIQRLSGATCKEIAGRYGISESLPREIVKGRCWPDALFAAKEMLCKN